MSDTSGYDVPSYRFICEDLNAVLHVRILSVEEEKELFERLRKGIIKAAGIVEIHSYREFLVKELLLNFEDFQGTLPDKEEETDEYNAYIECVYDSLVTAFPAFSLEFVCADINKEVFIEKHGENMTPELQQFLTHGIKAVSGVDDFEVPLSTKEQLVELKQNLLDSVIGQDHAVESLFKALKVRASGLATHCSFFFVGPTGVGKTELAKVLGTHFDGNFYKVNCAEYAKSHEYSKLIGSPPGYLGHDSKSVLAEKSEQSNAWVFLFDEIEKAHHKLYDFLLSLLDDGTCTDNSGNTLDFSNSVFIFTSNKGIDQVQREHLGFASLRTQTMAEVEKDTKHTTTKALESHFSPEFLNRLDEVVVFNHLSQEDAKEIVRIKLNELPIEVTDELVEFVVESGYSLKYGARNVQRHIRQHITPVVADAILERKMPRDTSYYKVQLTDEGVEVVDLIDLEEKAN